jgi:endonuclease/exonuclease/phosphatase family metal-dependent hydrolase
MKKVNLILLLAGALITLNGCYVSQDSIASRYLHFSSPQPAVVKAMTYNIRANTILDGPNCWYFRKNVVFDILTENTADVIGLQEAQRSQLMQVKKVLSQYSCYAIGRNDGIQSGESCPIFYRKDRFVLLDSGTFWFSDTPNVPGTKDWGNIVPRICSWVYLRENGQTTGFYIYNLHLAAFSQNSREKSVHLLAKRVANRRTKDPFIVMGDYNMALYNPAMMFLQKFGYQSPYPKMVDAWLSVHPNRAETSTRQSFQGRILGPQVDHIQICEDASVLEAKIDSREENGRYGSDHFPVIAKILIPTLPKVSQLNKKQDYFVNYQPR